MVSQEARKEIVQYIEYMAKSQRDYRTGKKKGFIFNMERDLDTFFLYAMISYKDLLYLRSILS